MLTTEGSVTINPNWGASHQELDYQLLAEALPQIVWTARPDGWIDYCNQRWIEYTGLTFEQTQGCGWESVVYPADLPLLMVCWETALETGEGYEVECRYQHVADGYYRWHLVRATPVRDETGQIVKWFGTCTDIDDQKKAHVTLQQAYENLQNQVAEHTADLTRTVAVLQKQIVEREQAEKAFQAGQERYQRIVETASEGIWALDEQWRTIYVNQQMAQMIGYTREEILGRPITDFLFEEDRAVMQQRLAWREKGQQERYDCRYQHKDGSELWVRVSATPVLADDGTFQGSFAMFTDITHTRQTEFALRESEDRFKRLAEAAFEALVITENGIIVDANSAFCKMYGYTIDQVIGKKAEDFTSPETRDLVQTMIAQGNERLYQSVGLRSDGTRFPTEVLGKAIPYYGRTCRVAAIRDITERREYEQQIEEQKRRLEAANSQLQEANAKLESLAMLDSLTGLKNHRTFQQRLSEECQRAARYQTPLSLLLVDVDHFKQYNDTFGHPAGDVALKTVAQLLHQQARDSDVVARYGGEEFAIILPQTDDAGAFVLAERICKAIESGPWPQRPITISGGVTTAQSTKINEADLIARADEALYRSKAAGRNRITQAVSAE